MKTLAACAVAAAVLLWPAGSSAQRLGRALSPVSTRAPIGPGSPGPLGWFSRLWNDDPVEIFRRWRAKRRPGDVEGAALAFLDAAAPALRAGLTPMAALRLAVGTSPGQPSAEGQRFLDEFEAAAVSGQPASEAWSRLATRSGSRPLAFVAGAWRLSERTGAPLAVAVERAAEGLRDARTRRRRVAVAVAGPRATVLVLTVLPLTGPLFGLACGLSPAELYLGSPLALVSVAFGVILLMLGRLWCRRLVRSAVGP